LAIFIALDGGLNDMIGVSMTRISQTAKPSSNGRNLVEEARRLKIVRYALGFGGHGGLKRFTTAYDLDYKRWSEFETGRNPIQIDDACVLIRVAMPDLTLDWIFRAAVAGLPLRLRAELEDAAAAFDADEDRK
jgi:hypothetical protein